MKLFEFKPKLVSCLKNYSKETFMADLMAGIIVGIVALPLAIAFGIVGYLFYKFSIPTAPFILASILGSMMESNYINSMVYTGSSMVFFTRPISCVLAIVSIIFVVWPYISPLFKKKKAQTV